MEWRAVSVFSNNIGICNLNYKKLNLKVLLNEVSYHSLDKMALTIMFSFSFDNKINHKFPALYKSEDRDHFQAVYKI